MSQLGDVGGNPFRPGVAAYGRFPWGSIGGILGIPPKCHVSSAVPFGLRAQRRGSEIVNTAKGER